MMLLQQTGQQGGGSMWIWIILLLVLMWVMMLRPQRKKEKEERAFRSGLKKGDRVIIAGGIHGRVSSVEENTVEVEVANGTVLTVEKSMIQPAAEEKK